MRDKHATREFWIGCTLTVLLSFSTSWTGVQTEMSATKVEILNMKEKDSENSAQLREMAVKIDAIYEKVVKQDKDIAIINATRK